MELSGCTALGTMNGGCVEPNTSVYLADGSRTVRVIPSVRLSDVMEKLRTSIHNLLRYNLIHIQDCAYIVFHLGIEFDMEIAVFTPPGPP